MNLSGCLGDLTKIDSDFYPDIVGTETNIESMRLPAMMLLFSS